MTTLLAVDVGNTNVTLGVFRGGSLAFSARFSTNPRRTLDEHAFLISGLLRAHGAAPGSVDAVAMCSVVPPLTDSVRGALEAITGQTPLLIGRGTRTGVKINYDRPQDVGADRIVDAAAAFALCGGPTTVVDLGTATVFDAISASGEYLGGALAPGIALSADALYNQTSLLRRVQLAAPARAIGTNTTMALQSGLVFGFVALVEGMVERFRQELCSGPDETMSVVATGGLAPVVARETNVFTVVDENLTLTGLRLLHELNS